MTTRDRTRIIVSVGAKNPTTLSLRWSDGTAADLPFPPQGAEIGEWGHSVVWPDGTERSADSLWLETLTATGHADARRFLEWRLSHGLSLSAAAEALGISRRMVAYYSNGEKPVPRPILLACRGWETERAA